MRPLNLARTPLQNERLPNVLSVAALVALVVATGVHAVKVRVLLPDRTSARHQALADLDAESARLRSEATQLRTQQAEPGDVARWSLVKDIVDRRAFSWTGLFARLEEVLPDGVRLVSIKPTLERGDIVLDVSAIGRSAEDGWELVRVLEQRPDFADVYPRTEGEAGQFRYTLRYRPGVPPPPRPRPATDEAAAGETTP